MRGPSSLSNRVFIASTLLTALSLGVAFYFVNARATFEAESELRRDLTDAAAIVDERRTVLTDTYTRLARVIADLPKLKAAVETGDPPTVQPLAEDYRQLMQADLLIVTDPKGHLLSSAGVERLSPTDEAAIVGSSSDSSTFVAHPRGLLQLVSVPIFLEPVEVLGRLTVGFFLDDRLAAELRRLTGSEVAFAARDRILAASIPADARRALAPVMTAAGITSVRIGNADYLALATALAPALAGTNSRGHPQVLVLRSRTERLRFLTTLRNGLAGALIVSVLLATILSYGVARTVTRPLSAVTDAMRDVAVTGDLTRRVPVRSRGWDDEDARLLASAYNTLTESIARFQSEATQRERLSSLGRLSTVIAHEIRNPLMIIRATLSTLRRDQVTASDVQEAVADIDEETLRLNRVVSDVLDFAKPIPVELADTRVNDICRTSAAAAMAGGTTCPLAFDLDPDDPLIVTDGERLRTALVNIIANARHAVEAAAATPAGDGDRREPAAAIGPGAGTSGVIVRTRRTGGRLHITVTDGGGGIATQDMGHIFDPYFTTRRTGTGLGLPIAKNIVERLGGTIAVVSAVGRGTEIDLDLPVAGPERTT